MEDEEPRLVLLSGDRKGTVYPLQSEETLIGRNPANDIAIDDDGVSREHAIVLRDGPVGDVSIEDLQSTNGTKVNGKRIRSVVLASGDEIQIGHTRLAFAVGPAPGGDPEPGS